MKTLTLSVQGAKREIPFNEHFANLAKINQSLNLGAQKSYLKRKRTYVDVPQLVGITGACENVDTLFKIGNRCDLPLFFSQTGQLALEQALQSFPSVFAVIHSGRDEEIEDARHLRQFRLTEEEFDSTTLGMSRLTYDEDAMYEALLQNIQITVQSMIKQILLDNQSILSSVYKRDTSRLERATKKQFLRIMYEDAVILLKEHGFPNLKFGEDLTSEHEATVVALVNHNHDELPVFIMKYPKEIKFFNMKVPNSDKRLALSADLIFPYAGEGTGSAVREHDFRKLNQRLLSSTMYRLHTMRGGTYTDFKWYLDIIKKKGTNPHAGYGIGNERVLQYVFGEADIRNVSLFAMLNMQTGDWNPQKYGSAALRPMKTPVVKTLKKPEV